MPKIVHLGTTDMKEIKIKSFVMKPLKITTVDFLAPSFQRLPCVCILKESRNYS